MPKVKEFYHFNKKDGAQRHLNFSHFLLEAISKIVDHVQGQGVDSVLKRSVHEVREHFKPDRNAAIEREMHF